MFHRHRDSRAPFVLEAFAAVIPPFSWLSVSISRPPMVDKERAI
jgi:hypothetical protein